jgi:hypothetical protein
MHKRWYVGLISIGLALNAMLFGLLLRRRSQVRVDQSTPDRAAALPSAAPPPPASDHQVIVAPSALLASQPVQPTPTSPPLTSSRQQAETQWPARVVVGAALIVVVLLAAQAQSIFGDVVWEQRDAGLPYALAAMLGFSLVAFLADRWLGRANDPTDCPTAPHKIATPARTNPWRDLQVIVRGHRWRLIGVIASSLMSLLVLGDLRTVSELPNYTATLGLWLASIVVFVMAVAIRKPRWRRDWKTWLRQNWLLIAAVGAIGALALILRVYDLGGIPPTMGGDEGSQGVEALKVLRGELRNPFITSWMSVPTLSFFFNALTIGPLGHTATALRLPWALIGTATVLIMFALARRLKGLVMGLMVGVLLAAYHYHIHYSRLGSNQVADAFFMALAFLFLYRAYDQGGMLNWVMAGVVAGLAQYFYAGARFTTIMVGVTLAYFIVRERLPFIRTHWRGLLGLLGAFLIAGGPMLQFALRYPDEYNGRLNAVGIYQSGWLEREVVITQKNEAELLLDQFKRSALAYNAYPDRTSWYSSPRPLFDGAWAVLFMLGLGYATLRPFDRRLFPMLIWWWGAIILGGMLTESPPSSQRLITSAPPSVFFTALALWKTGQIIERIFKHPTTAPQTAAQSVLPTPGTRRYALPALGIAAVVLLCLASIHWYFVEFTPLRTYGNYTAVAGDGIIRYAQEKLGPSYRMVYFGAPQMYIDFGSIKYLLPDIDSIDISEPLTGPFSPASLPADGKQPVFIALPSRRSELDFVRQTYPTGHFEEIPSPVPGAAEPIVFVYRIGE